MIADNEISDAPRSNKSGGLDEKWGPVDSLESRPMMLGQTWLKQPGYIPPAWKNPPNIVSTDEAVTILKDRALRNPNPNPPGLLCSLGTEEQIREKAAQAAQRLLYAFRAQPCMATFLGRNGYDHQLEAAMKVFQVGQEYEIVGGEIHSSSTSLEFKDIKGKWNSVMFDYDDERAPLKDMYSWWNN